MTTFTGMVRSIEWTINQPPEHPVLLHVRMETPTPYHDWQFALGIHTPCTIDGVEMPLPDALDWLYARETPAYVNLTSTGFGIITKADFTQGKP